MDKRKKIKGKRVIAGILLAGIMATTLAGCKNENISKKETEKIEKKIAETGFSKIHYVGNSFKKRSQVSDNSSLILSSHWRRGHWRNQRFGEKLIWIKPVIVNKSLGTPQKGHIYEI